MKYNDIRKFKSLVNKFTQKEALYEIMSAGFEPSVADAQAAGIADPRRVVNRLRNDHGLEIYSNPRRDRAGNVMNRYRLCA
jgi:hypothetical protein